MTPAACPTNPENQPAGLYSTKMPRLSLGTPLDVVRDILGHTTIKTTERYAHALVHRQRAALEGLGALVDLH